MLNLDSVTTENGDSSLLGYILEKKWISANMSNLKINKVPNLSKTILNSINLSNNKIKSIDGSVFPKTLKCLIVSNNILECLINLQEGLEILICKNNRLTNIDGLPSTLQILDCSFNKFSSIPRVGDRLKILRIYGSKIKIVDNIPPNSCSVFF